MRFFRRPGLSLRHYHYLGLDYIQHRYAARAARLSEFNLQHGFGAQYTNAPEATAQIFADLQSRATPIPQENPSSLSPSPPIGISDSIHIGLQALRESEWQDAQKHFDAVLDWEPGNLVALGNLAFVLRRLQRSDDAIACLQQSLAIEQRQPEAWLNLGNLFRDTGETGGAIECYETALKQRPALAIARRHLAAIRAEAEGSQSGTPPVTSSATTIQSTAATSVVPVLGMHRSGTSMLTRMLNLLGMSVGTTLLEANAGNERGYWEHTFFLNANMELLTGLNMPSEGYGDFGQLLEVFRICERVSPTPERRQQFLEVLEQQMGGGCWGWKDPRTVITWPMWHRLLQNTGHQDIRPIVIVRHPADVVRSFMVRYDSSEMTLSRDESAARVLGIWKAYNTILLKLIRESSCCVSLYEWLIDPAISKSETHRLAQYAGLPEEGVEAALNSIGERPLVSVEQLQHADAEAKDLYGQLRELAFQQTPAARFRLSDTTADLVAWTHKQAARLKNADRIADAVDLQRAVLQRHPDQTFVRVSLAYLLMETGNIAEAIRIARDLLSKSPELAEAHALMGFGFTQQGQIAESLTRFRNAMERAPDNHVVPANLLFASLYADHLSEQEITELHDELGSRIESVVTAVSIADNKSALAADMTPSPARRPASGQNRPLRVGYLSADFRKHPVGYFMRQILTHHDPDRVVSIGYDTTPVCDDFGEKLQSQAGDWRKCNGLSDVEIAAQIRTDAIDILVDLSGHSTGGRPGVLAQRSAPLQCLYLGYPGTSGMGCVDYVLVDRHLVPEDAADCEALYTESVERLPNSFLCFHPYDDAPAPAPAPVEANGFITFGSYNNLPKLTDSCIASWSRVLREVPDSRLILMSLPLLDAGTRELTWQRFESHGIEKRRVDLLPPTVPLNAFLEQYRRIDIGLDTLPFNGGTTTCEALWMGVPVITLAGKRFVSRMGVSILNTVGMPELITENADDYVQRCVQLASDHDRIVDLRKKLRSQVEESPLCDGPLFARHVEDALHRMWQRKFDQS